MTGRGGRRSARTGRRRLRRRSAAAAPPRPWRDPEAARRARRALPSPLQMGTPVDPASRLQAADDAGRGLKRPGTAKRHAPRAFEARRVGEFQRRVRREVGGDLQACTTGDRCAGGRGDDRRRSQPGTLARADGDRRERRGRASRDLRDHGLAGRRRHERLPFLDGPGEQVDVAERRQDRVRITREHGPGGRQHAGIAGPLDRGVASLARAVKEAPRASRSSARSEVGAVPATSSVRVIGVCATTTGAAASSRRSAPSRTSRRRAWRSLS